jgi:undecaprenyl-diphosphatase
MSWLELVTAALIQGATEFLPVSSSGHLALVHHVWGVAEPTLTVDLLLHVGTTAAVIVAYWHTLVRWCTERGRDMLMLCVAMVPTAIVGLLLRSVASLATMHVRWVGAGLVCTGLLVYVGNRLGSRVAQHGGGSPDMTWQQVLLIGVAQGCAVMPGLSRSGMTISAALGMGITPKRAVEFSLLLSIPAILGASLIEVVRSGSVLQGVSVPQALTALLLTFSIGWVCIRVLQHVVSWYRLAPFAGYCVALGAWICTRGLA